MANEIDWQEQYLESWYREYCELRGINYEIFMAQRKEYEAFRTAFGNSIIYTKPYEFKHKRKTILGLDVDEEPIPTFEVIHKKTTQHSQDDNKCIIEETDTYIKSIHVEKHIEKIPLAYGQDFSELPNLPVRVDEDTIKKHSLFLDSIKPVFTKYNIKYFYSYTHRVYLVQNNETGSVKVGFSTNVQQRIKALEVASGSELNLLLVLPASPDTEWAIHHRFHANRKKGEWFHYTGQFLEFVEDLLDCTKGMDRANI
jgi:hypothetical protein